MLKPPEMSTKLYKSIAPNAISPTKTAIIKPFSMVITAPKTPGFVQTTNSANAIKKVIRPAIFADNFIPNKQTNKTTIGISESKKSVISSNLSLLKHSTNLKIQKILFIYVGHTHSV